MEMAGRKTLLDQNHLEIERDQTDLQEKKDNLQQILVSLLVILVM